MGKKSAIKDYLQNCSKTSTEQASVTKSKTRLTEQRPCFLSKLLPPSKTLSDGRLLNSLLLHEIKNRTFWFPPPSPSLPTHPKKDCRNRTIWCCPSPLLRLRMEWRAWNTLKMRGSKEKWGRMRLQKYCDFKKRKKKENCSWVWNITRKKVCW